MANPLPIPVAMTAEELNHALSITDIDETLGYVNDLLSSLENVGYTAAVVVTKAIELYGIASHNIIDRAQPQDKYQKRKLFCAAQKALQVLVKCLTQRLDGWLEGLTVDEIEAQYWKPRTVTVPFNNLPAQLRHFVLISDYNHILSLSSRDLPNSAVLLHIFQAALGEEVGYMDPKTREEVTIAAFGPAVELIGKERRLWNTKACEFAVSAVIAMAKSVSVKSGNQSLNLMGTMIPVDSFQ